MRRVPRSPQSPPPPSLSRWTVILIVAVVFLAYAGWRFANQPILIGGPAVNDGTVAADPERTSGALASGQSGSGTFRLTQIGPEVFQSPAGLHYGPGAAGHRIDHVMRHAQDNPHRPQRHGVFDRSEKDAVLALLDEALLMARQGHGTQARDANHPSRTVWTIDMGRRIGYVGGQVGKEDGFPPCQRLVLVLDGVNVVTAYPIE